MVPLVLISLIWGCLASPSINRHGIRHTLIRIMRADLAKAYSFEEHRADPLVLYHAEARESSNSLPAPYFQSCKDNQKEVLYEAAKGMNITSIVS